MSAPLLDISLIIVNYNNADLLRACLESLPAACEGLTWEAIVVDNASADGAPNVVRTEFPEARLIANADNKGFTRANNQGLEIARGRYLCLLNNDTEARPGSFAAAVARMDERPEVGVAGLKLLNPDGSRQLSVRRFPSFQQALFNRYSILTRLFPNNPFSASYLMSDLEEDRERDVDWVSGACLVIRRDLFDRIGGLDEKFFMYSEDVDYCLRAWQAKTRVAYLPQGEVMHHIGKSSGKFPFMPLVQRHRSMYLFYKKHYSRELIFLDAVTFLMVWGRCGVQLVSVWAKRRGDRKRAGAGGARVVEGG
ncbi:MAG: glycosyltransferase family 2 protein [Sumerlaeia bacterium]